MNNEQSSSQLSASTPAQQLNALQKFTADLHQAFDPEEIVERVLDVLVGQFDVPSAVIGLIDIEEQMITNWLAHHRGEALPCQRTLSSLKIPLSREFGVLPTAVINKTTSPIAGNLTVNSALNDRFRIIEGLIVPLIWGVQPIGALLISGVSFSDKRVGSIEAIAKQTAVVIGMMQTRLRRAQELALKEERARIALDIHDSVSQSLFGLLLTLEASLKLIDSDPKAVKSELKWAINATNNVRQQIQQTIHDNWTEEISATAFEADLNKYVIDGLQALHLDVVFDIRGDFSSLSPQAQRTLYRISQESLTNIVHHAAASNARVCVDVYNQYARLVVRDNGRGFDPTRALAQPQKNEHFGLRGMQERSRSLGGTCDIFSQPEAGTSIVVEFPI